MTTEDYLKAVDRMDIREEADREALRRQVREGNPSARFVVYGWARREGKVWDSTIPPYGAWVTPSEREAAQ